MRTEDLQAALAMLTEIQPLGDVLRISSGGPDNLTAVEIHIQQARQDIESRLAPLVLP